MPYENASRDAPRAVWALPQNEKVAPEGRTPPRRPQEDESDLFETQSKIIQEYVVTGLSCEYLYIYK